jgi:hypothetical protein
MLRGTSIPRLLLVFAARHMPMTAARVAAYVDYVDYVYYVDYVV